MSSNRYNQMFKAAEGLMKFIQDPETVTLDNALQEKYNRVRWIENERNNGVLWPKLKKEFADHWDCAPQTAQWYINLYLEIKEKDIVVAPLLMLNEVAEKLEELYEKAKTDNPKLAVSILELKVETAKVAWDRMKKDTDDEEPKQPIILWVQNVKGPPKKIDAEDVRFDPVDERNLMLERVQLAGLPTVLPGHEEEDTDVEEGENEA